MIKNNFVAIDFETAQSPWRDLIFICQIGIVVVEDGVITEKISQLVQPPNNRYERSCIEIHGITPRMTKDAPTFDELWPNIEKYFINTTLIAHNAYIFDEKVLYHNLYYYEIYPKGINKFIDTKFLYKPNNLSLKDLSIGFGIKNINAHDALSDAICLAEIYLKYLKDEYPDFSKVVKHHQEVVMQEEDNEETKVNVEIKQKSNWFKNSHFVEQTELDKIKELTNEEFNEILSPTLFTKKRVINTGDLLCIKRSNLKEHVINCGGKYTSSLSKTVDIVILGMNPGPKKIETLIELQSSGNNIICINESHLEKYLTLIEYDAKN